MCTWRLMDEVQRVLLIPEQTLSCDAAERGVQIHLRWPLFTLNPDFAPRNNQCWTVCYNKAPTTCSTLSRSVIIVIKRKSEEVFIEKRLPGEWVRLQAKSGAETVSVLAVVAKISTGCQRNKYKSPQTPAGTVLCRLHYVMGNQWSLLQDFQSFSSRTIIFISLLFSCLNCDLTLVSTTFLMQEWIRY